MNAKIIADSTCDLPRDIIDKYDIDVVPLYVLLDGKSLRDGVDIKTEELIKWCSETGKLPTTSATSVEDFTEAFRPYAESGRPVMGIFISSEFSATVQNALIAAKSFEGAKIEVVDSRNLSTGIGLVVVNAAKLAQQGKSIEEIRKAVDSVIPRVRASFVVDKLDFLYKGGRCSALTLLGANALKIRPQIVVRDGRMSPGEKYRGSSLRAFGKYYEAILSNIDSIEPELAFVTHSPSDRELVDAALNAAKATGHFREVVETNAGCVITSHCGYNTVGILYIEKQK